MTRQHEVVDRGQRRQPRAPRAPRARAARARAASGAPPTASDDQRQRRRPATAGASRRRARPRPTARACACAASAPALDRRAAPAASGRPRSRSSGSPTGTAPVHISPEMKSNVYWRGLPPQPVHATSAERGHHREQHEHQRDVRAGRPPAAGGARRAARRRTSRRPHRLPEQVGERDRDAGHRVHQRPRAGSPGCRNTRSSGREVERLPIRPCSDASRIQAKYWSWSEASTPSAPVSARPLVSSAASTASDSAGEGDERAPARSGPARAAAERRSTRARPSVAGGGGHGAAR